MATLLAMLSHALAAPEYYLHPGGLLFSSELNALTKKVGNTEHLALNNFIAMFCSKLLTHCPPSKKCPSFSHDLSQIVQINGTFFSGEYCSFTAAIGSALLDDSM